MSMSSDGSRPTRTADRGIRSRSTCYLRGGPAAVPELARTIRHLLYGPSSEVDRLDDVLEDSAWKVRGFGEALAVKCLAIVYPDRWLPLFLYPGKNGKRAMMRLPELPIEPLSEHGKSRAELALESNDALRALLLPHFGDDAGVRCSFSGGGCSPPTETRRPRTGDRLRGQAASCALHELGVGQRSAVAPCRPCYRSGAGIRCRDGGSPRYRCGPRGANHKRSHSCKRLAVATVLCHRGSLEEGRSPSFRHPPASGSLARVLVLVRSGSEDWLEPVPAFLAEQ